MNLMYPIYRIYKWILWRSIKKNEMPQHIGMIIDGNRRFAKEKGLNAWDGHKIGAQKINDVLDWCWEAGIKIVTIYSFSTENFDRPEREVKEIMKIAKAKFEEILEDMRIHQHKVKVKAIGRLYLLPDSVKEAIQKAEKSTENYDQHFLNVAIGYGGRAEIVDAFKKIVKDVLSGQIIPEEINEEVIATNLYTAGLPDPDLIIRTSGEERLSGFLLWQAAYSELFFCDVYWPDFRKIDLLRAIRTFQRRSRRFGQ